MDCCGNLRKQIKNKENKAPRPPIIFVYIGRTSLIAIGGATGRRYIFEYPGARVAIDPRDRPSMTTVPVLRQIRAGGTNP